MRPIYIVSLISVLLFNPLSTAAEDSDASSIADAINAKWGAFEYKWGGENYYRIDKDEDESTEAVASTTETVQVETPKEKKVRRKARSLRSDKGGTGLKSAGSDAESTDAAP